MDYVLQAEAESQGLIAARRLPNDNVLAVMAMTYGKGRLVVATPRDWPEFYSDGW